MFKFKKKRSFKKAFQDSATSESDATYKLSPQIQKGISAGNSLLQV